MYLIAFSFLIRYIQVQREVVMTARLLHPQLAGCLPPSPASSFLHHALPIVEFVPAFLQLPTRLHDAQSHGFVQDFQQCFLCVDHFDPGLRGAWELG